MQPKHPSVTVSLIPRDDEPKLMVNRVLNALVAAGIDVAAFAADVKGVHPKLWGFVCLDYVNVSV
jgi:hypothetical protein